MKKRKKYVDSFLKERQYLLANGMSESQVRDFYESIAHDVITNEEQYERHNLSLESSSNDETGTFAYPRGTSRGADKSTDELEAAKKGDIAWSSIKMCIMPLATIDETDIYVEAVEIIEQLADRELQQVFRTLSKRRQFITILLCAGWSQRRIAKKLHISDTAVSNGVAVIRKTLEPYYRTRGWLKVK